MTETKNKCSKCGGRLVAEYIGSRAQFAEMTFDNGNSLFLNTEYITAYGYLKDQNETVVSVLSEAKAIYFPGDQTEKIRDSFNCIGVERR